MCLSPISIMNDGFCELGFYNKVIKTKEAIHLMDLAKDGGKHIYDPTITGIKFKNFRLTNKVVDKKDKN